MSTRGVEQFWNDQQGGTEASLYLLLAVILCLGAIPGLSTVRNFVVQEFGDVAVSLESLDQSFSFTVGTTTNQYTDPPTELEDPPDAAPACISLSEKASHER